MQTGSYRGNPPACKAVGNPEGSPSDPVTTDPKGEACRAAGDRKSMRHAIRRPSPRLSGGSGAYGAQLLRVTGEVKG